MKSLLLILVCASSFAFAAQEGEITMRTPGEQSTLTAQNLTEGGVSYTSLNDGSAYATVALIHEWSSGFGLGVRGFLPMQYTKQDSAYMGQVLARFIILNDANQIFVEPTVTQGFFNTPSQTLAFTNAGFDIGYQRQIRPDISVGGRLGADYSNSRITGGELATASTIYNKIAVTGAYYF